MLLTATRRTTRQSRTSGSPYLAPGCCGDDCEPWHGLSPAGRNGALATVRILATVCDGRLRASWRACRAARVVAIRTRRAWFLGLAKPRAFLATSFAVRLWASAFAFE
jgi:hypothetical protein